MSASPTPQCPPDCDLANTDAHNIEATADGATVVHHQRAFGPITVYLDEILGRPDYTVTAHVEETCIPASDDPAVALTQLAGAALRASLYVAQITGPPPRA